MEGSFTLSRDQGFVTSLSQRSQGHMGVSFFGVGTPILMVLQENTKDNHSFLGPFFFETDPHATFAHHSSGEPNGRGHGVCRWLSRLVFTANLKSRGALQVLGSMLA